MKKSEREKNVQIVKNLRGLHAKDLKFVIDELGYKALSDEAYYECYCKPMRESEERVITRIGYDALSDAGLKLLAKVQLEKKAMSKFSGNAES